MTSIALSAEAIDDSCCYARVKSGFQIGQCVEFCATNEGRKRVRQRSFGKIDINVVHQISDITGNI